MTDAFITQCPHCQSSFRIKRSQLDAAQETVRCGACLQQYNSVSQVNSSTIEQATPRSIAKHHPAITLLSAQTAKALPAPTPTRDRITQLSMIDNVIALSNLDAFDLEYEQERLEWDLHHPRETLERSILSPASSTQDTPESIQALEHHDSKQPAALTADNTVSTQSTDDKTQDIEEGSISAVLTQPASVLDSSTIESIHYFDDEPLRLDWQPTQKPWKRWHMWSLLNALAVVLLLSQYTHHNFTELARQSSTRPVLDVLCPLLGCQLPAKVDIEQIKSSNLVIRSHPEFKGALQVDAIIYNRAPFSQPFPLLELSFADANGMLLMSRTFKPDEYLSGELAGQGTMPQQVPIHIALEILEPSNETMNYSLKFVSPD